MKTRGRLPREQAVTPHGSDLLGVFRTARRQERGPHRAIFAPSQPKSQRDSSRGDESIASAGSDGGLLPMCYPAKTRRDDPEMR
jgi:hypothetical protein